MAGLGLSNAVQAFQQGMDWRDRQDEKNRQKVSQQQVMDAKAAGAKVLSDAQSAHDAEQATALEKWTQEHGSADGFTAKQFQPNPQLLMQAFDATGNSLAKDGNWDAWVANEAQAAPMREKYRSDTINKALQQYGLDGDVEAMANAVYPVIYDGHGIEGVVKGGGAVPANGLAVNPAQIEAAAGTEGYGQSSAGLAAANAKPTPETYAFKLSNGHTSEPMTADQWVEKVKWAAMNPADLRQYEMQQRILGAKLMYEKGVAEAKGSQDRQTEAQKAQSARGLQVLKDDRADARQSASDASAERRTATSASASRYGADQGLKAAQVRADAGKGSSKDQRTKTFNEIHRQVKDIAGKQVMGALGGTKLADEDTMNMARYAQALMDDDENLTAGDAIAQAISEFKKRK